MPRTLGWIAAIGLGVGVVSLSLAYVTGGRDVGRLLGRGQFALQSCGGKNGTAGGSERRLAWTGGDTIDIALPATVHFRGGAGDEVIVRGSPDVIGHVEVRGGRITLDCRGDLPGAIQIELPGRAFSAVRISGSARVT